MSCVYCVMGAEPFLRLSLTLLPRMRLHCLLQSIVELWPIKYIGIN